VYVFEIACDLPYACSFECVVHPGICLSIHLLVHMFIQTFVHLLAHSFTHSFYRYSPFFPSQSFMHASLQSFIHPFVISLTTHVYYVYLSVLVTLGSYVLHHLL
jgi:hypothetical protein